MSSLNLQAQQQRQRLLRRSRSSPASEAPAERYARLWRRRWRRPSHGGEKGRRDQAVEERGRDEKVDGRDIGEIYGRDAKHRENHIPIKTLGASEEGLESEIPVEKLAHGVAGRPGQERKSPGVPPR